MSVINFKSAGQDEEKESGTGAMFGYDIGDQDIWENLSCYFLPEVVTGGLEIMTIVFLLLIICERIPVNSLVCIIAPFTLTFLLASVATFAERNGRDDSVEMPGYISQCRKHISKMRFGALLSLFGAKCALIYMYSKNLSDAVSASESLLAFTKIDIALRDAATVPTRYFIMSLVCILFIMIVESALLITKIVEKYDAKGPHYAFALSFVDTLGISVFFLFQRVTGRQNEVIHSLNIISRLPAMFMIVGIVRLFVSLYILAWPEDSGALPCRDCFGVIHGFMAVLNVTSFLVASNTLLGGLKMICIVAITERLFLFVPHIFLGYSNRERRRLHPNADLKVGRTSAPSQSSPSQQIPPFAKKSVVKSHQPSLSAASQQAPPSPSLRLTQSGSAILRASSYSLSGASVLGPDGGAFDEEQPDGRPLLDNNAANQNDAEEPTHQLEQANGEHSIAAAHVDRAAEIQKRGSLMCEYIPKSAELERLKQKRDTIKKGWDTHRNWPANLEQEYERKKAMLVPLEKKLADLRAEANEGRDVAESIQYYENEIAELRKDISKALAAKTKYELKEFQARTQYETLSSQIETLTMQVEALHSAIEVLTRKQ